MEYRIINVLTENGKDELAVKDGVFCALDEISDSAEVIDGMGLRVRAGLVDVHSHGCIGFDTMDGHLSEMSAFQFAHGVTSWLPTTMTMPLSAVASATESIPPRKEGEARIMGFHLEGPYIAEKYKGAQNAAYLASPDLADLKAFKNYKMITLAPELAGALDFIRGADAVISLGHSEAGYDVAREAFRSGAKCLTHTFNAMTPLHHREPGLIGAAITEDGYAQVISDGLHLHPAVVLALYRIFGPERMLLISDSMLATGLADGVYSFGGQPTYVKNGEARIEGGNLAGGTTPLNECVKRAISFGIPEDDAYRMASATPATLMGWKKGRIAPGYDAEMIFLDDKGDLVRTLILE